MGKKSGEIQSFGAVSSLAGRILPARLKCMAADFRQIVQHRRSFVLATPGDNVTARFFIAGESDVTIFSGVLHQITK